jgi:hypothetical protein
VAIYDLYEIGADSITEARSLLESLLSISLEEHDSSFHRGPYFATGKKGEENFELKLNLDPYEDEPIEDEYSDSRFLFYVNNTRRSSELNSVLTKSNSRIKLLRREDI